MEVWARLDSTCARVERVIKGYLVIVSRRTEKEVAVTHVNVIDSSPPPAPARACAMLSPCWAAEVAETTSFGAVLDAMASNVCRNVFAISVELRLVRVSYERKLS